MRKRNNASRTDAHPLQRSQGEENRNYTETYAPLLRIAESNGDYFPVFGPEVPVTQTEVDNDG